MLYGMFLAEKFSLERCDKSDNGILVRGTVQKQQIVEHSSNNPNWQLNYTLRHAFGAFFLLSSKLCEHSIAAAASRVANSKNYKAPARKLLFLGQHKCLR